VIQHVYRMVLLGWATVSGIVPVSSAQEYPSKPIRLLVGFSPGGAADIIARIVGQKMSANLGQQIVIDNRAGAGSVIASEITAKSTPDGYTLLMISNSHAVNAGFHKTLPYDPVKDFAAISLVASAPLVLVVTASLPVNSIGELIALARSRPGQLNFGSSDSGGSSHLAGELLKKMAGIELTHVPYKGVAPALTDVIAGQVQMIFSSAPAALPQLKAGRIKAIAVTSAKRSAALPDVPTIADSGVPGYDATNWYGVLAPAALSKPLVERLNAEILKALRAADVIDGITRQGADPIGSTPGAFAAYLRSEITKWIKIVRDAGLRSD